jgi:drug/metabolite transporter (DMT)-like permease
MSRLAPPWQVACALAVVWVVWGSVFVAVKVVVDGAPALTSIGARYLLGGLVLGVTTTVVNGRTAMRLDRRTAVGCLVLAICLPVMSNGLVTYALSTGVNAGPAALLSAFSPISIVLLRAVSGDRPRVLSVVGVLVGFVGLALLVLRGDAAGGFPFAGSLLVLLAANFWALGSFVQSRLHVPHSMFALASYQMLIGGSVLLACGVARGETVTWDYSARTWVVFAYLTVSSCFTFALYAWLLAHAPISLVSTHAYVNPVVAVLLGWALLGEPLSVTVVVGGLVIVLAVVLVISAEASLRRGAVRELPV